MSDMVQTDDTTLILNGAPFTSFAEGDFVTFTFPNDLTSHVNHAGNAVSVNKRTDSSVCDMVARVAKFGDDDVRLSSAVNQAKPVVFNGSSKTPFDKNGVAGIASYILENGTITKRPVETSNNTEGNAMMEYTFRFRNASRNL